MTRQYNPLTLYTILVQINLIHHQFTALIDSPDFWTNLEWMVDALTPVYFLLNVVDGFNQTAGKVYHKCMRVQEHYEKLADAMKENATEDLLDMWKADWDAMHCAFHSVGYHLDPEYAYRMHAP